MNGYKSLAWLAVTALLALVGLSLVGLPGMQVAYGKPPKPTPTPTPGPTVTPVPPGVYYV